MNPGTPGGFGYATAQSYTPPPKPGVVPLRPLRLGELFDGAFQTIRRNAGAMFGSTLLVQGTGALLNLIIMLLLTGTSLILPFQTLENPGMTPFGAPAGDMQNFSQAMAPVLISIPVVTVILILTSVLLQGVLSVTTVRSALNLRTGFRQAWRLIKAVFWQLILLGVIYIIGATVIFGLVGLAMFGTIFALSNAPGQNIGWLISTVVLGFVGGAVLMLWLSIKVLFSAAAVAVERLSAVSAIRRSWQLSSKHFWRILGITLLTAFLAGLVTQLVTAPLSFLLMMLTVLFGLQEGTASASALVVIVYIVTFILTTLISAIALAFQTAVTSLLYLDVRMRKEGFDLELLREAEQPSADPDRIPGSPEAVAARGGNGQAAAGWNGEPQG